MRLGAARRQWNRRNCRMIQKQRFDWLRAFDSGRARGATERDSSLVQTKSCRRFSNSKESRMMTVIEIRLLPSG